jgi:hypothetical protein
MARHQRLLYEVRTSDSSLVYQADQQAFSMINDLRRQLSIYGVGIIAAGHNESMVDLLGEKIFEPKGLRLQVCPDGDHIDAEAVDS